MGLKDLREELLAMRESMEKMTDEIHETNNILRESLGTASKSIQALTDSLSKMVEETMNLKIQMDIKDTIMKSLGIDGVIPDFLKRRK
jgi:phage-related minor tail protein